MTGWVVGDAGRLAQEIADAGWPTWSIVPIQHVAAALAERRGRVRGALLRGTKVTAIE